MTNIDTIALCANAFIAGWLCCRKFTWWCLKDQKLIRSEDEWERAVKYDLE